MLLLVFREFPLASVQEAETGEELRFARWLFFCVEMECEETSRRPSIPFKLAVASNEALPETWR